MPQERKTICFEIADLANASDQTLEAIFSRRDGAWSSTTKRAIKRFQAAGLDLDSNWASTPQTWSCPACGREKPQLFRLTGNGILLARLDSHHDHLDDRLKDMLKAKLGTRWVEQVGPGVGRVQSLATRMIIRFERTLVCIDCNGVDGNIKKKIPQISKWFSFSPSEIKQFIVPRDNQEHVIDFDKASTLFQAALENFQRREALMLQLVEMMAAGELNQERGNVERYFSGTDFTNFLSAAMNSISSRSDLSRDYAIFESRSLSREGSSPPRPSSPATMSPTVEEVENHYGNGSLGLWRAVPLDWRCAGCSRSKAEVLRRSSNKKHQWSGRLCRHTEYVLEERYDEETGFPEVSVDHEVTHVICMDCSQITAEIRKQRSILGGSDRLLQLKDMRAVIRATPNMNHVVDWQEAFRRFEESEELVDLVARYFESRTKAAQCLWEYRRRMERYDNNVERARNALVSDYARRFNLRRDETYLFLKSQIARAQYLEQADTGRHFLKVRNPE